MNSREHFNEKIEVKVQVCQPHLNWLKEIFVPEVPQTRAEEIYKKGVENMSESELNSFLVKMAVKQLAKNHAIEKAKKLIYSTIK